MLNQQQISKDDLNSLRNDISKVVDEFNEIKTTIAQQQVKLGFLGKSIEKFDKEFKDTFDRFEQKTNEYHTKLEEHNKLIITQNIELSAITKSKKLFITICVIVLTSLIGFVGHTQISGPTTDTKESEESVQLQKTKLVKEMVINILKEINKNGIR